MPFTKYKPLDPQDRPCNHPEHDPPGMLVQEPGTYTWQCPRCGREVTYVVPPRPICSIDTLPPETTLVPWNPEWANPSIDCITKPYDPLLSFHHTF